VLAVLPFVLSLAIIAAVLFANPFISRTQASYLATATIYSTLRVFLAFIASMLLGVIIGYYAGVSRAAEKLIIPLLDIGQSVPVLGFFPFAIIFMIGLFGGSHWGVEAAAVFLIITGMIWNMSFAVYESIRTIPQDLRLMTKSFKVDGWLLFRKVYLPAFTPKLVYNCIVSWSVAWYWLVACEIISLGNSNYNLVGLGAFLANSTASGDLTATLMGLIVMALVILTVDVFLWSPLSKWSNNFKYDVTREEVYRFNFRQTLYRAFGWIPVGQGWVKAVHNTFDGFLAFLQGRRAYLQFAFNALKTIILVGLGLLCAYFAWLLAQFLFGLVTNPLPTGSGEIPIAIAYSTLRLIVAFLISLVWTVPAAFIIARNATANKYLVPIFEVAAAIPATALFPLFIVAFAVTSIELPSILLIVTGMQFYLLFNLVAGIQALPAELGELSKSFGVKGWLYWRKVLIPAIFPSLVTGSISAFGGGWNALVLAEYINYGNTSYSVGHGIGKLLDLAARQTGSLNLLSLSLLCMVAFIVLINTAVWKPLYYYASTKYHVDY
jgi:NitT/TauT family transport system permease protein